MPIIGNLLYVAIIWDILILIALFQGGFDSPSIVGVK